MILKLNLNDLIEDKIKSTRQHIIHETMCLEGSGHCYRQSNDLVELDL